MSARLRRVAAVVLALSLFSASGAHSHPMPRDTRDAEIYFMHRCNESSVSAIKACIHRAAIHWKVPAATGYKIASHETGHDDSNSFNPNICNYEGSGACGLFQFMLGTYNGTPYDTSCGDRFVAKCASLAWAWHWARGNYSAWAGAY